MFQCPSLKWWQLKTCWKQVGDVRPKEKRDAVREVSGGEGVNNGNEVGKSILSKPMEIFVC